MTVEQAVLDLIIGYVRAGKRCVPIYEVESAHPRHTLSGRARLRGLRLRGFVNYKSHHQDNSYEILSSEAELLEARNKLFNGRSRMESSKVPADPGTVSLSCLSKRSAGVQDKVPADPGKVPATDQAVPLEPVSDEDFKALLESLAV